MKFLSLVVFALTTASCSAVMKPRPIMKFNLSEIKFSDPETTQGIIMSEDELKASNKHAWEYGSCYKQPVKKGRNSVTAQSSKWPGNTLYYSLSYVFNDQQRESIAKSMQNIETNTCIKFVPRTTQTDYVFITGENNGCWSYLGRLGGMQILNLQLQGCLYEIGTGIHELLHALGTHHEHNRNDRDTYVTVNFNNVNPDSVSQFNKVSATDATTFGLAYDYASIMHYSRTAFTSNGQDTIVPTQANAPATLGTDTGLSPLDIAKLKALYNCP